MLRSGRGALLVLWQAVCRWRVRVGVLWRRRRTLLVMLVHYARGTRLLKVVRRRTLLGVVGMVLLEKTLASLLCKRDISQIQPPWRKVKRVVM